MPNTNDSHGESKVIYEDDDWLIVEPMDYESYTYTSPDNLKSEWNRFRDGDIFFIVDKNNNATYAGGFKTYMIYIEEDKTYYYNWNGKEIKTKKRFIRDFPTHIIQQVNDIIGVGDIYKLLTKIAKGEQVSSRELENADDAIYDFKYTPKAPFKSKIDLRFDEDDYIKLFNPSDDDMWYYNAITGNYDTYEWEDDYQATQDFREGYFFNQFNQENLKKIRQILSIISPQSVELETDEEIESIIYEYTSETNECKTRGFNKMIEDDFCNPFYNYGIFTKHCLRDYFTSVGMLLSLYDTMGDKTLTISELLFRIGSDMEITGWSDYIYEIDGVDFDQESFDSECSRYLDKIIDKLEDESQYVDIYAYADIYKRLDSKFKINNRYKTKSGREFFYRGINPKNNRILIQVFKKDGSVGTEDRSYSEEEFENFLVSPELFEGFIRIN